MKVYYINEYTGNVISLDSLKKLDKYTRIVVDYQDRKIEYTIPDIYECKDWKVYTKDDTSLTIDEVRELMQVTEKGSSLYHKLRAEESRLLDIWTEEITSNFQLERSLF